MKFNAKGKRKSARIAGSRGCAFGLIYGALVVACSDATTSPTKPGVGVATPQGDRAGAATQQGIARTATSAKTSKPAAPATSSAIDSETAAATPTKNLRFYV